MTPENRRAALETEAERIKKRLDRIHAQLEGDQDAWFHLAEKLPEGVAEVTVDKALAEARQQALALATIVRVLDGTAGKEETPAAAGVDPADEVKAKRDKKLRDAQSGI